MLTQSQLPDHDMLIHNKEKMSNLKAMMLTSTPEPGDKHHQQCDKSEALFTSQDAMKRAHHDFHDIPAAKVEDRLTKHSQRRL